jgi:hypothetical protein
LLGEASGPEFGLAVTCVSTLGEFVAGTWVLPSVPTLVVLAASSALLGFVPQWVSDKLKRPRAAKRATRVRDMPGTLAEPRRHLK